VIDWLRTLYDAYHALGADRDPQWSVSIEVADVLVRHLTQVEAALAPEDGPMVVVDAGSGLSSCVIRRWAADLPSERTHIVSTDLDGQYLKRAAEDAASVVVTPPGFVWHEFTMHDTLDLPDVLVRTPVHVAFWDLGRRGDRLRRLGPFVDRFRPYRIVLDDWNREPDAKRMGYDLHERGYEVVRAGPKVGRYAGVARLTSMGRPGFYAQCRLCGTWGSTPGKFAPACALCLSEAA
jgi:hypothetical protein